MKLFAMVVFVIHTILELVFGLSAYLSGASSSQSAGQIAQQSVELTIAFRFLGSALISLGILGAIVIFFVGVRSLTARFVATGFATFHALGAVGSFWSAMPGFEVYSSPLAVGALTAHAALATSFAVVACFPVKGSTCKPGFGRHGGKKRSRH